MPDDLARELRDLALASGLDLVGIAGVEPFELERAAIEDRRSRGLHAGMHFTYGRPARATDPRRTMPEARALVVGALDHVRSAPDEAPSPAGRVAAYQWDDHYARLRGALDVLAAHLRAAGHRAMVLADDNRLVDRAAARRAGLGWIGKNTSLLVPGRGSSFLLGSVLTDAPLEPGAEPVPDGCGTCRRCIDACPTGALDVPGELDARRCLAWLVQADGVFPPEHRVALGDRLYGCDDCQTACPPNRVELRRRAGTLVEVDPRRCAVDLVELLELTDDDLMERFGAWYVPRRQPDYLRRNALVVLGNVADGHDPRVERVLRRHLAGPPLVAAHAVWAARRLGRDDLLELADDGDDLVRAELARPVPVGATT